MTSALIETITKLYLYGEDSIPSSLLDDGLIRVSGASASLTLDGADYMASGAGRFATVAQSELVQAFFGNTAISIDDGVYTHPRWPAF